MFAAAVEPGSSPLTSAHIPTPMSGAAGEAPASSLEAVGRLNAFLHGEVAATEAYRITLDRLANASDGAACRGVLRQFQEEHETAADALRQFIADLGGGVLDQSGSWGPWARAVQSTADLFTHVGGGESAMECLLHGEQSTIETYIASRADLHPQSTAFVQEQLIPAQRRHARMLRQLLGKGDEA